MTKSLGFRRDSAPPSPPTLSQNRSRLKEKWSPIFFPHILGGPGAARSRGRPGLAGRYLAGQSSPPWKGLKGPRGGAGGPVQGGGAAHQSRGAVPVLFFLLALLSRLYWPLFLLLPGGSFWRRRPGLLGAEAVGAAA